MIKGYDNPDTIEGQVYAELCCIADNCIIGKEEMEIFDLCADNIMHLVYLGLNGVDNEFKKDH